MTPVKKTTRAKKRTTSKSIYSMTAFGRSSKHFKGFTVTVEIKSINHRYLEIDYRMPPGLSFVQAKLTQTLRESLRRGRVEMTVIIQTDKANKRVVCFDDKLLTSYHRALQELKGRFGLKGPLTLEHLLTVPNALQVSEDKIPPESLAKPIEDVTKLALKEHVGNRLKEGARLVTDLKNQVKSIDKSARAVKRRLPTAFREQKQYLQKRIKTMIGTKAKVTSAQLEEVLSLIKDVDVNEELVRIESHIEHIQQTLAGTKLVGKQLDFIAQELTRETNTLGAKVNDALAAREVVAIKGCIEKIREQAQNLE